MDNKFKAEDLDLNEILLGEQKEESPQPSQRELFLDKMIGEIFSTKDIDLKTDINDKQVLVFSRAKIYAKTFNMPLVMEFCDSIKILSISKGRKSRGELVDVTKGGSGLDEPLNVNTFSNRFLGV